MKKIILTFAIVAAGLTLHAQQEAQFTQFMYNKLLINPAYAGARGVPSLTAIYRSQWLGFEGAPQSALASFNSPFLSNRVGVGVTLNHKTIGLQRDFRATLAYSYDMVAQEGVSVRVGLSGSIRSLSRDFGDASPLTPIDPSLETQKINDFFGNVGAGIYGTFAERYYVGVSVPHLYSNVMGFNTDPNVTTLAKERQHFYAMAGGIFPVGEDINLMPALLLKYVNNAPFDADLNVNLDIRQKFTAGLSYRLGGDGAGESVGLLAYWQATPLVGVGAAYDFSLSGLRDYNAGSVEVLLLADLKQKTNGRRKMSNPRFFM
jgi:type IX secretion system PorP/SprF family membrane protein